MRIARDMLGLVRVAFALFVLILLIPFALVAKFRDRHFLGVVGVLVLGVLFGWTAVFVWQYLR